MWGIVPAAGHGSRIQPLAFSKELLPVGSRRDGERERPRAVSEYLVERLVLGGADKVCFVISPGKSDILQYYGGEAFSARVFYSVQPEPAGLCDAVFRALPLIDSSEHVLVGLPDTIWFPADALAALPNDVLSFLLFPVERPELFDAVVLEKDGDIQPGLSSLSLPIQQIQVKDPHAASRWIWGAFKMPGAILRELHALWVARDRKDEYIGTLVNAWLTQGRDAYGVRAGTSYVDVGTVRGYREAVRLLTDDVGDVTTRHVSPQVG
jgi:glucose-1-phosphate thymidylyltransferase